jgi:hypothetical protein
MPPEFTLLGDTLNGLLSLPSDHPGAPPPCREEEEVAHATLQWPALHKFGLSADQVAQRDCIATECSHC